MAEIPEDTKFLLFGFGPKMHARMALVANSLGIVAWLVGMVSAVTGNPLGLGAGVWFLLTVVFFLWGISFWLSAYFGAKEGFSR